MKIIGSNKLKKNFFKFKEFEEIKIVKKILNDVKTNEDNAIKKYNKKFDGISLVNFEISKKQVKEAYKIVDKKEISALKTAANNIKYFAKKQLSQLKNFEIKNKGVVLGQKVIPLERVGCYVPGGRYPLPSSALMSVIPAKVAKVKEIIVCSPKIKPVTILAAHIAGADRIFNLGPKADKIVGPGNKYVAAAKKEVYGIVGIDFIAGPSEILIIADETGNPEFLAADLLAQAEHDPNSGVNMITTSKKLANDVNNQLNLQLKKLKTKEIAKNPLKNGIIIIVDNVDEAVEITNKKAPEHLELQIKNPKKIMDKLNNYGSLFIGNYSAEAFGDYCAGTNHILPTNGAAKYTGGLSVRDFVKCVTYQKITKKSFGKIAKTASILANIEGLDAHKKSAKIRIRNYLNHSRK